MWKYFAEELQQPLGCVAAFKAAMLGRLYYFVNDYHECLLFFYVKLIVLYVDIPNRYTQPLMD